MVWMNGWHLTTRYISLNPRATEMKAYPFSSKKFSGNLFPPFEPWLTVDSNKDRKATGFLFGVEFDLCGWVSGRASEDTDYFNSFRGSSGKPWRIHATCDIDCIPPSLHPQKITFLSFIGLLKLGVAAKKLMWLLSASTNHMIAIFSLWRLNRVSRWKELQRRWATCGSRGLAIRIFPDVICPEFWVSIWSNLTRVLWATSQNRSGI